MQSPFPLLSNRIKGAVFYKDGDDILNCAIDFKFKESCSADTFTRCDKKWIQKEGVMQRSCYFKAETLLANDVTIEDAEEEEVEEGPAPGEEDEDEDEDDEEESMF